MLTTCFHSNFDPVHRYKNRSGNSGIEAFESGTGFIRVRFQGGATYLYTDKSAGKSTIEKMKQLAITGKGLNTFISTHVKNDYSEKEE